MQGLLTVAGFAIYLLNVLVGVAAQTLGWSFGRWHHVLYALVFALALAAAVARFHPGLVVTLVALAVFPRARPGTTLHPLLAGVGLLGYCAALGWG